MRAQVGKRFGFLDGEQGKDGLPIPVTPVNAVDLISLVLARVERAADVSNLLRVPDAQARLSSAEDRFVSALHTIAGSPRGTAQSFKDKKGKLVILQTLDGPSTALWWDEAARFAIALDVAKVSPGGVQLLIESVMEAFDEFPNTIASALGVVAKAVGKIFGKALIGLLEGLLAPVIDAAKRIGVPTLLALGAGVYLLTRKEGAHGEE